MKIILEDEKRIKDIIIEYIEGCNIESRKDAEYIAKCIIERIKGED